MNHHGHHFPRRIQACVALLLAGFALSNATAQTLRPEWIDRDSATITNHSDNAAKPATIQQTVYQPQDIHTTAEQPVVPTIGASATTGKDEPTREAKLDALVAQLPEGDSHMVKFIELLQWAVLVSIVAVVAALLIRKFKPNGIQLSSNTLIEHLASLRVNNQFHAHVLEINDQRFLITTDRAGVKTVNQVTSVGDFQTALEDIAA